jgi:hypothetical protein
VTVRAPAPIVDVLHKLCTDGIEHDIAEEFEQVLLSLDIEIVIAALLEVTAQPVAPIEFLRVFAVQEMHCGRKVCIGCPEHHMKMVRHQAQAVDLDIEPPCGFFQKAKPKEAIVFVYENVHSTISTGRDVVNRTGE